MKQPNSCNINTGGAFRLSPNEVTRLLKEEREKRRKLRIVQVREQSKANAAVLRQAVRKEKDKQLQKLAHNLQEEWKAGKEEKLRQTQQLYDRSVQLVGQAHTQAVTEAPDPAVRLLIAEEDQWKAESREKAALKLLRQEQQQNEQQATQHIRAREKALEEEKLRAARIAALPPPPPKPKDNPDQSSIRVKLTDLDACSSTYPHLYTADQCVVERASATEQGDARAAAAEAEFHIHYIKGEKERIIAERREKARLRHKYAREKELLKLDYGNMLHDLSDLQRADVHRRQQVVAKIPKQIFVPPHRRLEEQQDQQQDLERAFEDLYMAQTDQMGDLSLALDPQSLPDTPTATASLDLSVDGGRPEMQQTPVSSKAPAVLSDVTNLKGLAATKQLFDKTKTPDTGLRKLLGRIRAQRENWTSTASETTATEGEEKQSVTSSSRSSEPSLTQYTLTSADLPSDPDPSDDLTQTSTVPSSGGDSLSTGEIESKSTHSAAETLSTLEEGTFTPSSGSEVNRSLGQDTVQENTLRHPMEQAAKIRHLPVGPVSSDLSAFLAEERAKQARIREETDLIKHQTAKQQQLIDEQRRQLEERLREIEARKQQLISQVAAPAIHGPGPTSGLTTSVTLPSTGTRMALSSEVTTLPGTGRVVTFAEPVSHSAGDTQHTDSKLSSRYVYQPSTAPTSDIAHQRQTNSRVDADFHPSTQYTGALGTASSMLHPAIPGATGTAASSMLYPAILGAAGTAASSILYPAVPPVYNSTANEDKVRQYQQTLLHRQRDRHAALQQARQDLERKAAELFEANQTALLSTPAQADPLTGLGHFQDVELSLSTEQDLSTGSQHYQPTVSQHYQPTVSQSLGQHYQPTVSQSLGQHYQLTVNQSLGQHYQPTVSQSLGQPYQPTVSQSLGQPYQPTVSQSLGQPYQATVSQSLGQPYQPTVSQSLGQPYQPTVSQSLSLHSSQVEQRSQWQGDDLEERPGQTQWQREDLEERPGQTQWQREDLEERPGQTQWQREDLEERPGQTQWQREDLEERPGQTQWQREDLEEQPGQTQWQREDLEERPGQTQWQKEDLEERPGQTQWQREDLEELSGQIQDFEERPGQTQWQREDLEELPSPREDFEERPVQTQWLREDFEERSRKHEAEMERLRDRWQLHHRTEIASSTKPQPLTYEQILAKHKHASSPTVVASTSSPVSAKTPENPSTLLPWTETAESAKAPSPATEFRPLEESAITPTEPFGRHSVQQHLDMTGTPGISELSQYTIASSKRLSAEPSLLGASGRLFSLTQHSLLDAEQSLTASGRPSSLTQHSLLDAEQSLAASGRPSSLTQHSLLDESKTPKLYAEQSLLGANGRLSSLTQHSLLDESKTPRLSYGSTLSQHHLPASETKDQDLGSAGRGRLRISEPVVEADSPQWQALVQDEARVHSLDQDLGSAGRRRLQISEPVDAGSPQWQALVQDEDGVRLTDIVEVDTPRGGAQYYSADSQVSPVSAPGTHISASSPIPDTEETGISDEPDLTLVSVTSSWSPGKLTSDLDVKENEGERSEPGHSPGQLNRSEGAQQSSSLLSFEQHEDSLQGASDVSPQLPGEGSTSTSVSLQDAFKQQKKQFIQHSQARQSTVGHTRTEKKEHAALGRTLASWKKSRTAQPLAKPENKVHRDPTDIVEKTTDDRKKTEKEMKGRTERLHSQLEEVKLKRQQEQLKQEYAENRKKAKEYQKKYQEQLQKRKGKKS